MKFTYLKSSMLLILGLFITNSSVVYAQAKNNQQLSNDVTIIQQKLDKVQKDMSKLNRLLDNRALLDLFQRMDELADEVSNLRGQLEQQTHDLAGLKKRQRELYLDTDRRLRELEMTSNRAPVQPSTITEQTMPPVPVTPVEQQTPSPQQPASGNEAGAASTAQPVVSRPATVSTSAKPSVSVSEEREAYQKAFDMLKEGRYKMANTSFNDFVKRFPDSSYAGNAQYWLGESNYVSRNFKQAVEEFQKVMKLYPRSNKVPDAMLKLGYTYYELREFDLAKSILVDLRKTYPKSTASRLAAKRIERMNKEGH